MGWAETQSIGRTLIDRQHPDTVFVAAALRRFLPAYDERGVYRTQSNG